MVGIIFLLNVVATLASLAMGGTFWKTGLVLFFVISFVIVADLLSFGKCNECGKITWMAIARRSWDIFLQEDVYVCKCGGHLRHWL